LGGLLVLDEQVNWSKVVSGDGLLGFRVGLTLVRVRERGESRVDQVWRVLVSPIDMLRAIALVETLVH